MACPVTLIQGSDDPVVLPDAVKGIVELLSDAPVELAMIDSERHGIINEDIGETRATIVASLDAWANPAGNDQSLS